MFCSIDSNLETYSPLLSGTPETASTAIDPVAAAAAAIVSDKEDELLFELLDEPSDSPSLPWFFMLSSTPLCLTIYSPTNLGILSEGRFPFGIQPLVCVVGTSGWMRFPFSSIPNSASFPVIPAYLPICIS